MSNHPVKKKAPAVVDQQLEFESAQLLLIALRPLSRKARARVLAFVTSQLEEMDPSSRQPALRVGSPFSFFLSTPPSDDGDDDGDGE